MYEELLEVSETSTGRSCVAVQIL